jgi:hypothetical protein
MAIHLATKTLSLIETLMEADQGAAFRVAQGKVMPHMKDAYRGADEGFRTHLGSSIIGKTCAREIWYGWRWFKKPRFSGRMLRLFNRGHLEEARFIAMFLSVGFQFYQQDANGNQFRISELGGHFGGSGDGVVLGIPDVPSGQPCLAEFKTHGDNPFKKLMKFGVQISKFEHYVQMQTYMRKMKINYAIYCAINKNTDEIYMEIITLDTLIADQFLERGKTIVMMRQIPDRIQHASMGFEECRWCDFQDICLMNDKPDRNCRTCFNAVPKEDGTWWCESKERRLGMVFPSVDPADKTDGETFELSKERQLVGCKNFYVPI